MRSLVSVMMPCFNGARTLPWALASLVAQTHSEARLGEELMDCFLGTETRPD